MKKFLKIVAILGTIIALGAIVYGGVKLYRIDKEYKEVDETYAKVLDICIDDNLTVDVSELEEDEHIENVESVFKVNWEELKNINQDSIAWIRIDDTNINYPIVQGTDNEEYIKKDIYKNTSKGGCIFVDCNSINPFHDLNTVVYGHNLNNGAMFNDLKKYENEEFARDHRKIYIAMENESLRIYKVFGFAKVNWDNNEIYDNSVNDLNDLYERIGKYNQINIVENLDTSKPVITLSTCTNANKNERYVVFAYLDV